MSPDAPQAVTRTGVARWKGGTLPQHGALVACDVLAGILMPFVAVLCWLIHLPLWLTVPSTIAGLGAIATAVHEMFLLRRAAG